MRTSSKWTKWQIGLVSAMIVVYLFQEVKESPEFVTAVRDASNSKLNASTIVTPKKTDTQSTEQLGRNSGDRMERRGRSRDQLNRTDDSLTTATTTTNTTAAAANTTATTATNTTTSADSHKKSCILTSCRDRR